MNFKETRKLLRQRLDRETTAALLAVIGIEITRDWRFRSNPSFSIRRDGWIKDFGTTEFAGDFIAYLIEQRNIPAAEAISWTAKALNVDEVHDE